MKLTTATHNDIIFMWGECVGELKNREQFSTTLLKWQAEEVRKLSAITKRSISSFIEEAMDDLFIKYGIEKEKEPN